jgi:hypothetical protein
MAIIKDKLFNTISPKSLRSVVMEKFESQLLSDELLLDRGPWTERDSNKMKIT